MIVPLETKSGRDLLEADLPGSIPAPSAGADVETTIQSIREARDRVLSKNRELIDRLAESEDKVAEMTYERDDALAARDAGLAEIANLARRLTEMETQLAEAAAASNADPTASAELQAQFDEVVRAITTERDAAVADLTARDAEVADLHGMLERSATDAAKASRLEGELTTAWSEIEKLKTEHARFATMQKKNVASLAEQLAAAQRARATALQERDAAKKFAVAMRTEFEARIAALEVSAETSVPAAIAELKRPAAGLEPEPEPAAAPLSGDEVHEAVTAMFGAVAAVKAAPGDTELLAGMEQGFLQFASSAAASGLPMMNTLGLAAGALAGRLHATPGRCEGSLPTLEKAVEVLGWLTLRDQSQEIDTAGSLVFAVDDDVDNCECIAMELEKLAIQTKYTVTPEAALEQIAALGCDLIVLDVDLPRLDGFAVHTRIREMENHKTTPVIFLSGHLTTGDRLAGLHDSNALFIAKPYVLCELSLRILTLIVQARLG